MYGKSVFRVKGVTMIRYLYRVLILAMLTGVVLVSPHAQAAGARKDSSQPLKAFLFKDIPVDQDAREKLFLSLKGRGANAVIIDTAGQSHLTDEDVLPNLVFLVHKAQLKLFLMVPVRNLPSVVSEHRKWEDLRYDLTSGTTQPTGKLSLFHPDAVNYLAESIKKIASYSVDGILLGEDFFYGDTEGMTRDVLEAYKDKCNAALVPGKAIAKVGSSAEGPVCLAYGEGFTEWAEMKRDQLVLVLQTLMDAARAENKQIEFGLPLHAPGLVSPQEALSRYSYDVNAFKALNVDYFWITIPHRDIRARDNLGFKETMETLAQTAQAALTTVKDPYKTIIVLQTTYPSGRLLPYSEIEDVTALAKKDGKPSIAYMLSENGLLPKSLSKKLFRPKKAERR